MTTIHYTYHYFKIHFISWSYFKWDCCLYLFRTSSHFSFSFTSDFIKVHFHVSTIQNQGIEDRVLSSLMLQSNYVIYSITKIYLKFVIRFLRTSAKTVDIAKMLLMTSPLGAGASSRDSLLAQFTSQRHRERLILDSNVQAWLQNHCGAARMRQGRNSTTQRQESCFVCFSYKG